MSLMKKVFCLALCFCFTACSNPVKIPQFNPVAWDGSPARASDSVFTFPTGTRGMVACDDRLAAEWAVKILNAGGNAVDAAVAVGFMLSVTRPHYGSLGGGGFMVYCPPSQGKPSQCVSIDYRETAGHQATRDMYLRNGKADPNLSRIGALASGTPGVVAGLLHALQKYGKLDRKQILSRPIELAQNGVSLSALTEAAIDDRWGDLNGGAKQVFGCRQGGELRPCPVNSLLKQPDLAKVLTEVRSKGRAGFYEGWVAHRIVQGLKEAGGILELQDFKAYQAKERQPVQGSYQGMEVISMPPPSSGGSVLLQLLAFAEKARATGQFSDGYGAVKSWHALAHAMRLAFADRAEFFGDPDFVQVPWRKLISSDYIESRWKSFDPHHADHKSGAGAVANEGGNTTHFSVVDAQGGAVAVTTTINDWLGSAFVPPGTGIVMNNEMDDFSAQAGVPNLYGLVGKDANAIAPGKRPLSSMSPTILRNPDGQVRMVIGAQGGPRIITGVFLSLINRFEFGMSILDAVSAPRVHHQWKPDAIQIEPGIPADVLRELIAMGYEVKPSSGAGRLHAIERFPNGRVWGVSDPRTEGAAIAQ